MLVGFLRLCLVLVTYEMSTTPLTTIASCMGASLHINPENQRQNANRREPAEAGLPCQQ